MTNETILHKTLTSISGPATIPLSEQQPPDPLLLKEGEISRKRWLKIATGSPDRAGDQLVLAGMDATNFRMNPQFLWQHGASGALVNTIGSVLDLTVIGNGLYAQVEYAPAETSPLAEQVFQMDLLGLLPANSIGFRPIEWEANDTGGNTFTKWELIECSKVELPMNPEAVDRAKSCSIEDAAEWLLQ